MNVLQSAGINYGVIALGAGDGPGGTDGGISDNGNGVASVVATDYTQATFSKGAVHFATIRVTNLEPGENVVLRFEVDIACTGNPPTGNLQAVLSGARVIDPADQAGTISVGSLQAHRPAQAAAEAVAVSNPEWLGPLSDESGPNPGARPGVHRWPASVGRSRREDHQTHHSARAAWTSTRPARASDFSKWEPGALRL